MHINFITTKNGKKSFNKKKTTTKKLTALNISCKALLLWFGVVFFPSQIKEEEEDGKLLYMGDTHSHTYLIFYSFDSYNDRTNTQKKKRNQTFFILF